MLPATCWGRISFSEIRTCIFVFVRSDNSPAEKSVDGAIGFVDFLFTARENSAS